MVIILQESVFDNRSCSTVSIHTDGLTKDLARTCSVFGSDDDTDALMRWHRGTRVRYSLPIVRSRSRSHENSLGKLVKDIIKYHNLEYLSS